MPVFIVILSGGSPSVSDICILIESVSKFPQEFTTLSALTAATSTIATTNHQLSIDHDDEVALHPLSNQVKIQLKHQIYFHKSYLPEKM